LALRRTQASRSISAASPGRKAPRRTSDQWNGTRVRGATKVAEPSSAHGAARRLRGTAGQPAHAARACARVSRGRDVDVTRLLERAARIVEFSEQLAGALEAPSLGVPKVCPECGLDEMSEDVLAAHRERHRWGCA
jgi:hypothetical protein